MDTRDRETRERDIILGELREFKRSTLHELAQIKEDLNRLQGFKLKITGGIVVFVALWEAVKTKIGF